MRTQTFISSMVGVAAAVAVAGSANAALVTGTYSGSTSSIQYYVKQSGYWIVYGSVQQRGAFSGTFQFDTAGAVDTDTAQAHALYSLSGTITLAGTGTYYGRTTAAGPPLKLQSTVNGSGLDTFKLYKYEDSSSENSSMSISTNLPSNTYAFGDFVPTVPLNLTGISGLYENNNLPTTGGNGTSGYTSTGTITNLTLTVVPAPAAAALLGLAGLVAGRRRRN